MKTTKIYKEKKIIWNKLLTRNNSIFMDYVKLHGASHLFLKIGYDYRIKNYKIVNGENYIAQDYDLYVANLKNKYKKDKNIIDNIFNSGISNIKKFETFWKQTGKVNAKFLSDAELKKIFENYVGTLYQLMAYLFTPLFAEKILTDEINEIVNKYSSESNKNTLLQILTSPKELSFVQKENIDFFKMMKKMSADKAKNDKLIVNHLAKWGWLGDHTFIGEFWTIKDITTRIKNLKNKNFAKEIKTIKQNLINTKNNYNIIIKNWKPTQREKHILNLAKKFVFFRTFRLDALFYSEFLTQNILSEIAKRLRLGYKELVMLSPVEISNAIINKYNYRDEISKRKKSYVIILEDYNVKIYLGRATQQFIETKKVDNEVKEIKGNPAFLGIVRGYVKIIMNKNDFNKFNAREILVTPMTTPDFVPLMKRCSAIITDEGGITCHAAIISRELEIPCIIGTKIATKVLKDGDYVEVDANNGVIKIL